MVYLPPAFTETRDEVLLAHLERHDFGLLVTHGPAGLIASQIPFVVTAKCSNSARTVGGQREANYADGCGAGMYLL